MVGERDSKFYSELKQMNEDLVAYLKETNDKSPYFDFTPTLNDYVKQIEDLDKQYPEKTGEKPAPKQPSIFNINATPFIPSASIASATPISHANSLSQPPTSTLSFGSSATTQPTFIFGAPQNQAPAATSPSPFFSFTLPKKTEEETASNNQGNADEANEAADDDAPPPDSTIDRYQEPNAKHSVKCKLYEKGSDGPVNLLGIGYVYLKTLDNPHKLQVIFRQEPDLRRVLLNEVISANIPGQVKLLPKAVQLMFPNQKGDIKCYITKVKDDNDANTLFDHLNMTK